MKNKFFLICVLIVFILIGLMIVTKVLMFPFSYIVTNNTVAIDVIIILDVLIFFSVIQLERSTLRYSKRDEKTVDDVNITNATEVFLSAILVTLGFNLLGFGYFVISGKSLDASLLSIFFMTFVLLYIIYLIFVVLLFINRRTKKRKT